jgi:hypothetical protein
MKDLAKRLNNVHTMIQNIEFSIHQDLFDEAEYKYIYTTLQDARELMEYLYPVEVTRK